MKKVILDTDMGVDCDDAVALALLLKKMKEGECELLCVTASSTREGATATIKAICDYYEASSMPIGAMAYPAIPCDSMNNYGRAVKYAYGKEDVDTDAIALMRKHLALVKEKTTLIAIGPLTNIKRLLQSGADTYSNQNGLELVKEKVEAVYVMGGSFAENYERKGWANRKACAEWNIVQDIPSASFVVENLPCPVYFLPYEAGWEVFTEMRSGENPVWFSMKQYAISEHLSYEPSFFRHSWDPITCLCALSDVDAYFEFSKGGKITVTEEGKTVYTEKENGMAHFALLKDNYKNVANLINDMFKGD